MKKEKTALYINKSTLYLNNDVIIIAGPVVKSAIARVKIKLGYRRIYRTRANVFLRRYAPKFEKVFPIFPIFSNFFQSFLEKLAWKKSLEKNGIDP